MDSSTGANEDFSQVILFVAQAGFARDVAHASGVCRALWRDERLWEVLVRLNRETKPGNSSHIRSWYSLSALSACAFSGDVKRLRWLLARHADLNTYAMSLALHAACYSGHENIALILIKMGAEVNARTGKDGGDTALHAAATGGMAAVVTALLERGADVHARVARVSQEVQPLHQACSMGHDAIVLALIAGGALVDSPDSEGWTPLHHACEYGYQSTAVILLDHGANVGARTKNKLLTPLHMAETPSLVTTLIDRGALIDAQAIHGETPLLRLCHHGHLSAALALIALGAGVQTSNRLGDFPLHVASRAGHAGLVACLLERGASADALTRNLRTPLHYACQKGRLSVALALLERGANINAKDDSGTTPCQMACEHRHVDVVIALLDRGADVNAKSNAGSTLLHAATSLGSEETVAALIQRGANLNVRMGPEEQTPLQVAIECRFEGTAMALVAAGADLRAADHLGRTALHYCCKHDFESLAVALVERGRDPHARGKLCIAPVEFATAALATRLGAIVARIRKHAVQALALAGDLERTG